MKKKQFKFKKPKDFFNDNDLELKELLKIPHVIVENDLVKSYKIKQDKYNEVIIYEYKKEINEIFNGSLDMDKFINHKELKEIFGDEIIDIYMDVFSNRYNEKPKRKENIIIHTDKQLKFLFKQLFTYNEIIAEDWINKFNDNYLNNSREIISYADRIKRQTKNMYEYLQKNNVVVPFFDLEPNKIRAKQEIEDLYYKIEDKNLVGYNDLDYYPFIYNDKYIIEDVSADALYICDYKDSENLIWYNVERQYASYRDLEDHSNISKYYIKDSIDFELTHTNKIFEIKNSNVILANPEIETIKLLQGFIHKELVKSKKIKLTPMELSFERLFKNYVAQKSSSYDIEERLFKDFLEDLIAVDGVLTYENFGYIKDSDIQEINRHEPSSFIIPDKINIKIKFNEEQIQEINDYLEKTRLELSYGNINEYIDTYKTLINDSVPKKSKKIKM